MRTVALVVCLALGGEAAADIYSWEDKDGIIHFTNIPPPGGKPSHWKTLYKTGPGKAAAVSGTTVAGCRVSRADVIPARDRSPDRYVRYDPIIREAARLYSIPEALVRAVIKVESDYDPRVVSCAGAKGLMQLMPYEEKSQHITQVFDPRQNILAGTRLLRMNANKFRGNLVLTIASYHAGVGAVRKYKGVPPYQTTQDYVRMVVSQFQRFRQKEASSSLGAYGKRG